MSLRITSKSSIAACAIILPLTLAACSGADEEAKKPAPTSTAVKSSSAASSSASSSAAPTTSAPAEPSASAPASESAPAPATQAAPAADPAAAVADPFQGANPAAAAPLPPLEEAQEADPATREQLAGLVNGIYAQNDLRSFMNYIPSNTCQKILDQNKEQLSQLDVNQLPPISMADAVGPSWANVGMQSMEDVKVKGDEASATVTVNTPQGVDTSVMRFKNEGGRWTFCGA